MKQRTASFSFFLPLALMVSVTLTACQSNGTQMNTAQNPHQNTQESEPSTPAKPNADLTLVGTWRLDPTQPPELPFSEQAQNTLRLTFTAEGKGRAYAGCNRLSFQYELTDQAGIHLSVLAITKKACPDMKDERIFAGFLSTLSRYQIQENTLILLNTQGQQLRLTATP